MSTRLPSAMLASTRCRPQLAFGTGCRTGAPEEGVRRHRRVESREGDRAADLPIRPAGRDVLEVAADVVALSHGHVAAEQDRGDELAPFRGIGIDLLLDQLAQDEGPLRV